MLTREELLELPIFRTDWQPLASAEEVDVFRRLRQAYLKSEPLAQHLLRGALTHRGLRIHLELTESGALVVGASTT